jgi:hypothetical protein
MRSFMSYQQIAVHHEIKRYRERRCICFSKWKNIAIKIKSENPYYSRSHYDKYFQTLLELFHSTVHIVLIHFLFMKVPLCLSIYQFINLLSGSVWCGILTAQKGRLFCVRKRGSWRRWNEVPWSYFGMRKRVCKKQR